MLDDKFYERLQLARRNAGFSTASEAAKRFGWNENTYKSHDNGVRKPGDSQTVKDYARAYKADFIWLYFGDRGPGGNKKTGFEDPEAESGPPQPGPVAGIPIIGAVGVGDFQPAPNAREEYVPRPASLADRSGLHAYYVIGDLMAPHFASGDKIIIDPETAPKPGDDVVFRAVRFDGDIAPRRYFKRFRGEKDGWAIFEQFNTQGIDRFRTTDIKWMYRVIPKSEF